MKNVLYRVLFFTGIILLSVACLSCISTGGGTHELVVDENNPEYENATITFANQDPFIGTTYMFRLKKWNIYEIQDDLYKGKKSIRFKDPVVLTVPSGENSFLFDLYFRYSNQYSSTTYSFTDCQFRYYMQAGKKYEVKAADKSVGVFHREFLISIYDVTNGSELLDEWVIGSTKKD